MNSARLQRIRREEKAYHEQYFEEHDLYEKDSWLEEPDGRVLAYLEKLQEGNPLQVLDLGCGVGRNSIPLARKLQPTGGKVVCVDLLDKAVEELEANSGKYGVQGLIETGQADISEYKVPENTFDYILAASSLEHVRSEAALEKVLAGLAAGTRDGGINFLLMNTNIREVDAETGGERETLIELILSKEQALEKFRQAYSGWEELEVSHKPLDIEINRGETPVIMKTDCLSYAVRKPQAGR
ncbi:class I SAM-dependent methyltransferase [Paenibacillus sp. UNC499MF]|uniref:class I SAM-dependent methyltransferase n=1 Tax=Paenibacillus sp. UNC499MF TaxID=1502751 RepID=UPI00089F9D8F|nr:class I SAM-dependent methyltransferase [Paenibacillus sp. UNC499MF]SEG43113.1 Methyltransferase domain-containing protein [Paenibacillus sp. UNC499MF]